MTKTCFECGMEGETWTGPVFSSAAKLQEFYQNLGISDPLIEKMKDGDLLCSKCANKAECRHALKCYTYYKDKWTPEQYEIWAKNNANLISLAETELKEQRKISDNSSEINSKSIKYECEKKFEKLAIIEGTIKNGQLESTGNAITDSELSIKFEAFCSAHTGKIIDWNISQQDSSENWLIFVRYFD